jgi:hypothetical protein
VRYFYGLAIFGILSLWTAGLGWMTLAAIIALFVFVCVRVGVVRRHHEVWMDDLARATYRLMRSPSVRHTTSWPEE